MSTLFSTGHTNKVIPYNKFYISGIETGIFTQFTQFTDEDSAHMCCKFYSNNKCGSTYTTV